MSEATTPAAIDPAAIGPAPHELTQQQQLFQHAADHGADLVQLNKEWTAAGGTGEITPTKAPDPAHTGDQALLEQELQPGKLSDYRMPFMPDATAEQALAAQKTSAEWSMEGRLSPEKHAFITEEIARLTPRYQSMDAGARDLFAKTERAKVDKVFGKDSATMVSRARQLVREVEARKPGLVRLLEESGGGNSASVIVALAQQATMLGMRGK
jgi:hypothetical protein